MDQTQVLGDNARKPRTHLLRGHRINLRLLDWIWNIRGSVPLAPGQSSDEAFARLDPLFQQPGTTYERTGDTLVFAKKDQAAQDKMSIFDAGALQIEPGKDGAVLRYRMASRALLFCFLAPLLFLAFGQLIVAVGKLAGPETEAAEKDKDKKKKEVVRELHPIDKFLGAPAPEKPKDDKKTDEKKDGKHSPTAAYVFAALFAALYAAGRVLEDRLIRGLFRKKLHAG
jgi:hypothetical protein